MDKMISISKAAKILGVTTRTLKRWDETGVLKVYRTIGNHRRYKKSDVEALFGLNDEKESSEEKAFIYVRVSTKKQTESGNLERQKKRLIAYCKEKNYTISSIYEETASGLNDSRKELIKMFRQLNEVDTIVIEYTDRLARFGYKYLEEFAKSYGVRVEAVEQKEKLETNEEMVKDLVSIVTCFSARLYGERGGKKIRKALKELETERQAEKNESYNKSNAN